MSGRLTAFPEPASTDDLRGLLLDYLDFFRDTVAGKLTGLSDDDLQRSLVPSGWTPAGLVTHLVHMERRWLRWGFLAEPQPDVWGDSDPDSGDDGWRSPAVSAPELAAELAAVGAETRATVERHDLLDVARTGGRFGPDDPPVQLQWVLLHVIQEYARHTGHLDIARELLDGRTGEEASAED